MTLVTATPGALALVVVMLLARGAPSMLRRRRPVGLKRGTCGGEDKWWGFLIWTTVYGESPARNRARRVNTLRMKHRAHLAVKLRRMQFSRKPLQTFTLDTNSPGDARIGTPPKQHGAHSAAKHAKSRFSGYKLFRFHHSQFFMNSLCRVLNQLIYY